MPKTRILSSRPHAAGRHQRGGQREDVRAYPPSGDNWGQKGWVSGAGIAQSAPTVGSVTPSTAAVGAAPLDVVVAGTNFEGDVEVYHLGERMQVKSVTPPTSVTVTLAKAGTAGASAQIYVIQDGVKSNIVLFAWTATGLFTVVGATIAAVQAYVDGLGDPAASETQAEIQRLVDEERANANRVTLVNWLDAKLGVV